MHEQLEKRSAGCSQPVRWAVVWVVVGITLTAAVLRLAQAGESLWLDELHTAWVVAGESGEVGLRARIGNQSPLYFYLARASTSLFGANEIAIRLPSLLAGLALVPLASWFALRWTRSGAAAAIVALLVAVDYNCVFYSQEARVYAWVQLVGLVQVGCFRRLLQTPAVLCRVVFVAATILLFYLHYTSVLLVPAECAAYAIGRGWRRRTGAYSLSALACDVTIAALAASPALPQLWDIAGRRENWSLFVSQAPPGRLLTVFPLIAPVVVPLGGLVVARLLLPRSDNTARRGDLTTAVLVVCWFAVPVTASWLLTALDVARLFMVRYLVVAAVAPMELCGILLAACPSRRFRGMLAASVAIVAIWQSGMYAQWRFDGRLIGDRNQDWRGAAALVRDAGRTDLFPVFVRSGFIEADRLRDEEDRLLREYCLAPLRSMYRIDESRHELIPLPTSRSGQLDEPLIAEIRAHGGVWFVVNGGSRSRPQIESDLAAALRQAGLSSRESWRREFGDVLVLRVQLDPAAGQDTNMSRRGAEPAE